jgi:mannose/fructose/N-acetylgalactosamine-specific phosphotransferase system component IIC
MFGNPAMEGGVFLLTTSGDFPSLGLLMFEELILICMFGGLVALDKTEACQTMLSQPLFIGAAVGLLLGDLPGGLFIGVLLQLAYLWVMPIGTPAFPDPAVGAVAGSSGFIFLSRLYPDRSDLILLAVLIFVIPFSLFAGWSLVKQRQLNSRLLPKADLYAERVKIRGYRHLFFLGLSGSFARGFVVTGSGTLCVLILLKPLVKLLSLVPDPYVQGIEVPIWGMGIGTMIYLFGRKPNLLWCVGGACLGIVFILL